MHVTSRPQMKALTEEEGGAILAALREWSQCNADPTSQQLHDRLADCVDIFVAEYETNTDED